MDSHFHIDYGPISSLYAKEQINGTLYLAFRDLPSLIDRYLPSGLFFICALDFGCGTGVSTRYLKGLETILNERYASPYYTFVLSKTPLA